MKYLFLLFFFFSLSINLSYADDGLEGGYNPNFNNYTDPNFSGTEESRYIEGCPTGTNGVCLPATQQVIRAPSGGTITASECASTCGDRGIHSYQKDSAGNWLSCTCNSGSNDGENNARSNKPGTSSTSKDAQDGAAACKAAYQKTNMMCKGAVIAQQTQQLQQMMSMMQSAQAANNTKKACETAAKINTITGTLNAAVGGTCLYSIKSCKASCDPKKGVSGLTSIGIGEMDMNDAFDKCENEFAAAAGQAIAQAMQNAMTVMGSRACADQVADKCLGGDAENNEDCVQFCLKPGRQDHPKCKIAFNNCANQTYASQNVQMCTCMMNPLAQGCQGSQLGALTPTKPPALNLQEDAVGGSEYDFNGAAGGGNPASVNSADGSGGGFSGGGSSSPFGEAAGGGAGGEALNKDILTGSGGSAGGVGGIYGGGGYGEGGGGLGGKKGNGEEKGFDLSQFLPGGKKDPTRNPASAGYEDSTITKANGLTNFQKVTRKMNEKRPELAP